MTKPQHNQGDTLTVGSLVKSKNDKCLGVIVKITNDRKYLVQWLTSVAMTYDIEEMEAYNTLVAIG